MRRIDISGQKFSRLTVIHHIDGYYWLCRCECGVEKRVKSSNLKSGNVRSCGCLSVDRSKLTNRKHGGFGTPEYYLWNAMIHRCTHETCDKWEYYGGRGIDVCSRWRNGENGLHGFECFLADMGSRPTPKHTLDRINNAADYSPDNCKWITHKENCRNRRSNVMVVYDGREMLLSDAVQYVYNGPKAWNLFSGVYYPRTRAGMTPQEALDSIIAKRRKSGKLQSPPAAD